MLVAPRSLQDALTSLKDRPFIMREPDVVLGEPDIILKIECKDFVAVRDFLMMIQDPVSGVQGLVKTTTLLSLNPGKHVGKESIDAYVLAMGLPGILNAHEFSKVEGVTEAHPVLGNFDLVCEVKAQSPNLLRDIIRASLKIRRLSGITGTVTYLVAGKEFVAESLG